MKNETYSEKLKNPKWQKKRLEILQRDEFKCRLCHDEETELQVHHKEYNKGSSPWEYENDKLVTLCSHCHEIIEISKTQIPQFNFDNILSAGFIDGDRKIILISYTNKGLLMICFYQKERTFFYHFNIEQKNELFQCLSNF